MRRPVAFFLLALVAIVAGGWTAWRSRTAALVARLQRDVHDVESATGSRLPSADPPEAGSFGEIIDRGDVALEAAWKARPPRFPDDCGPVWREAEAEVPTACRDLAAAGAPAIAVVRRAAHAQRAGPPKGVSPLANDPGDAWLHVQYVVELGAIDVRLRARTDPSGALDECVDLLGAARDAGWGGNLLGLRIGFAYDEITFAPCVEAIAHAPPDTLARFSTGIARVRAGLPPLSLAWREWEIYAELSAYGGLIPAADIAAFPPDAVEDIRQAPIPPGPIARWLAIDGWHRYVDGIDQMIAAADLPPDQRDAVSERVRDGFTHSWNPAVHGGGASALFATDFDRSRTRFRALSLAVAIVQRHSTDGTWQLPTDSPDAKGAALDATDAAHPLLSVDGPSGPTLLRL